MPSICDSGTTLDRQQQRAVLPYPFYHSWYNAHALLSRPHKATQVKGNRNPARSLAHPFAGKNNFCVCRVRVDVALTTIKSFDNLSRANGFMHRMAPHTPGPYGQNSRQVLGRVDL